MPDVPINPSWSQNDALATFDGEGPRSEILKLLYAIDRRDLFLNVGYSRRFQRHWSTKAQIRLVDRLAKRMLRRSQLEPVLLDIGSGRGGPAIRLRQKWEMDVTGIDPSEKNLELARRRTRDLAIHEGLLFRHGSVAHLPFSGETFSFAWSIETMAYVPDKPLAFEEIRRVLKPGGRLAMAVLLVNETAVESSNENRGLYLDFLEAWDFHGLWTAEAYAAALAESGLEVKRSAIVTRQTLEPHRTRLARVLWLWRAGPLYSFSRWYVRRRTEADLDPIKHQLEVTQRTLDAGLIEYGLFWAAAV